MRASEPARKTEIIDGECAFAQEQNVPRERDSSILSRVIDALYICYEKIAREN